MDGKRTATTVSKSAADEMAEMDAEDARRKAAMSDSDQLSNMFVWLIKAMLM